MFAFVLPSHYMLMMYFKVLCVSFSKVHILTTAYQNAFTFGPEVLWRVGFHSMTLDPRVPAPWVGLEVKI